MAALKAAVVSRHPLVLLGLRALLAGRPDAVSVVDAGEHHGHLAGLDAVVYDLAGLDGTDGSDLRDWCGATRRSSASSGTGVTTSSSGPGTSA